MDRERAAIDGVAEGISVGRGHVLAPPRGAGELDGCGMLSRGVQVVAALVAADHDIEWPIACHVT
jgi:hypothetical protein